MDILSIAVTLACITLVTGCSVSEWEEMTMQQRLYLSDLVVLGTHEIEDVSTDPSPELWTGMNKTDSIFDVWCVLKGDGKDVNETIRIEWISPLSSCQETYLTIGQQIIIGLKRIESGNYKFHETNVMQSIAFPYTQSNLDEIVELCGLQTHTRPNPSYGEDRCPKLDDSVFTKPCVILSLGSHAVVNVFVIVSICFISMFV